MDNKYFTKGATVYLPVQVPGALFHVGDPHAAQGNGEVSQSAIESSNTVTLQFVLRKDLHLKKVRGEDATHYIIMGMDADLDVAMHSAIAASVDFLVETKGMTFFDALSLCSVAVDFEVTEVVDGTKCISGRIPKSLFSEYRAASYWYHAGDVALASAH